MATANGSGDQRRAEHDDPDRTQRVPAMQEVVDEWFPDESTTDRQQGGGPLMAKDKQPQPKPETKAQRQARQDSAFECPDCPASFSTVGDLGVHAWAAHTVGMR